MVSRIKKYQSEYYKKGYLKIKNFFSKEEFRVILRETNRAQKLKPKVGREMIYYENNQLNRTENFLKYNKTLRNLFEKKINLFLEKLLSNKIIIFKDKINWKLPGSNGFEPHQDSQVWKNLYKNIDRFFSVLVSIDKSNVKNGCLEVVPYKHNDGLFGDNKSAIPDKICKKFNWIKLPTNPRDIIIFDSFTPHKSKKNTSNKMRRLMYLTYNFKKDGNLKEEYFLNKRKKFPPNIERRKGKKYKYLI